MTFSPDTTLDAVAAARIVPVVEIDDAAAAVPLASALQAAGLPVMEVTLRTPAAIEAIAAIASEMPEFLVGAGTLLSSRQIKNARRAGARFGVSPGWALDLAEEAAESGLPYIPGAITPSEVLAATTAGYRRLKYFPAATFGGVAGVRALAAPFASAGVSFMPTGGVSPQNVADYLALPGVFAVGGTWIAPRQRIAAGDFSGVRDAAAVAIDVIGQRAAS